MGCWDGMKDGMVLLNWQRPWKHLELSGRHWPERALESANILNMLDVSSEGPEVWTHAIYRIRCYTYSLITLRPKLNMNTLTTNLTFFHFFIN